MLNKNNQFALGLMLVIAILLTACTVIPVATDAPIPEAVPTEETIAPTIAAVDKPTPEPADVLESCPVPSESTSLYISRENGFCF